MKSAPMLFTLLLGVVCLSPAHAQSPQKPAPLKVDPTSSRVDPASVALKHSPDAPDNEKVLASDPRLRMKLTFRRQDLSIQKALDDLGFFTHISFVADSNEIRPQTISFSFVDTPLKDILDAIAALGDYEWERRKSGVFVLRPQGADRHARTHQATLDKTGKKFKEALDKLPDDLKASLSKPYNTPLSSLPPEMQAQVQDLLSDLSQMYPSTNPDHPDALSTAQSSLSDLKIGWEVQTQEDGTYYYLNVAFHNGGGSWLVGHD